MVFVRMIIKFEIIFAFLFALRVKVVTHLLSAVADFLGAARGAPAGGPTTLTKHNTHNIINKTKSVACPTPTQGRQRGGSGRRKC